MSTTRIPISTNSFYIKEGQAIVSFAGTLDSDLDIGKVAKVPRPGGGESVEIMRWGKHNDLPQQRERLVSDNNIVPSLISKKRDILCGAGLYVFTERFEALPEGGMKKITEEMEMPAEIKDWLEMTEYESVLEASANELMKHSLMIPEFIREKGSRVKIASVEIKECKWMRAARKDDKGKIPKWYWSGHWGPSKDNKDQMSKAKTIEIPVYAGESAKQLRFCKAYGDFLFSDGYYPIPAWWGGWDWVELANCIPEFHRNNLLHGYNIRWHIKIPADYFLDYEAYNNADDEGRKKVLKTAEAKEQQFVDDINKVLAGSANAGKTVITKKRIDEIGKEYPGIEITPLQYDMKDEALLALFDKSNTANISAQGLHPTLAGVETQGKLSSGTEIRNAYLMWLIINANGPRRKMLEPLRLVQKINGWDPKLKFGIRDFELTALSTDPSGMQQRDPNAPQQP